MTGILFADGRTRPRLRPAYGWAPHLATLADLAPTCSRSNRAAISTSSASSARATTTTAGGTARCSSASPTGTSAAWRSASRSQPASASSAVPLASRRRGREFPLRRARSCRRGLRGSRAPGIRGPRVRRDLRARATPDRRLNVSFGSTLDGTSGIAARLATRAKSRASRHGRELSDEIVRRSRQAW